VSARPDPVRDPAERAILVLFALLSVWPLAFLVKQALTGSLVWTGTDGLHVSDQVQYLNWIRDAGEHILISNHYELGSTQASFLHPGFLLTGLVSDLGVAPWLAYLLWKPVMVVALFLAVRAYMHRTIATRGARIAALILGLFFVPTAAFISSWLLGRPNVYLLGVEVELWPGTWLWGYAFTVLAVAAIPAALLLFERDRARGRIGAAAPVVGLLCSWFQPWQGATLLGTMIATELAVGAIDRADRAAWGRRLPLLAVNAGAVTAPLAYYAVLSRVDPSWANANNVNTFGGWPLWTLLVSFGPLALPAALAYRLRVREFQDLAVRIWPLVGLGVYWLIAYAHVGTFPIHSFQGLTIPLAILAVVGAGTLVRDWTSGARAAAAAAVALLIVPALVWKLSDARRSLDQNAVVFAGAPPNTYFLKRSESDALRFVDDDPRPGGVLTQFYLGQLVPAETGRHTWVGAVSWTPNILSRIDAVDHLFVGALAPAKATAFVRSTGARFVISSCQDHVDLASLLRTIVETQRRFGCAEVLYIR
jgi:hypothetical protein